MHARRLLWSLGVAAALVAAAAVAWSLRGRRAEGQRTAAIWTCSMHPQIRLDHPGLCPICGMDLVPVASQSGGASEPASEITLAPDAVRMARLESVELRKQTLFKVLRTVGKVEYDETALVYVTARIAGRVDEVFANFPGTAVKQGDHLVSIYSPDLLATQAEFLDAVRRERATPGRGGGGLSESARRRLELWGVTPQQIEELLGSGQPQDHLVIYAPFGGTIVEKSIRPGQYVATGDTLYRLADLSRVWLILEVFESDIAWVRFGQPVDVTLEGFPEQVMTGSVAFIEPVLNEETRTVRVRVVLPNPDGLLKPGMYAQALLQIPILETGRPGPTGLEGKHVCPMHPFIVQPQAGDCSICGMPLEKMPPADPQGAALDTLAVPADAVLSTGRRQLVYVDRGQGRYELVAPHLGPRAGDYYPVLHGLNPGDRVVRRGNFLLDSQFQISGKPSLLYPDAMHAAAADGHDHVQPGPGEVDARVAANLARLPKVERAEAEAQKVCPVTGLRLGTMGPPVAIQLDGKRVYLCCPACRREAADDPQAVLDKLPPRPPAEAE